MDVGPGGYVAAIKAAQLGLKVSLSLRHIEDILRIYSGKIDSMHRKAWLPWGNMSERWLHSIQGHAQ